ncbi:hypothetical protein FB645_001932 [Coemansia sp. IMI 203386]|nr:hypothetical protein FB645_001932 [Coemansia sp. IMI 203386]
MLKARDSVRKAGMASYQSMGLSLLRGFTQKTVRPISRLQPVLLFANSYHDNAEYGYFSAPRTLAEKYTPEELDNRQKNANLLQLAEAYRRYGHLASNLDPLSLQKTDGYVWLGREV